MSTNKNNNDIQAHDPSESFAAKIIDWSVANRFFVLLGAFALLVAGSVSITKMPLDAIPDLSDTQVIIRTQWSGQAPQIMEDQVTFPISSQMLGLPKTKVVRGFSMFGTSFVYIIFEDNTDMYWARSRVLESLSQVRGDLPDGVTPELGPDATGVGWVFQYALYDRTGSHDLAKLRSLQDWFVKFELATIDGVAEVASVGGFVKEYQVLVDPNKLRSFNVSLKDVIEATRSANQETGGRTMEMAESEYLIRSFGYLENPQDLEQAVIKSIDGTPITIADIGRVVEGAGLRRGVAELNGVGEVVGGIVVMRPGGNALDVIHNVKQRLESVKQGLPAGVEIKVIYDRSELIENSVDFLKDKLIEESLMVALVIFLFLLHARSALVAVITLPLGILAAFLVMSMQGITANIMSLGGIAIAIGAMVDASIVMVENAHRKISVINDNDSNVTPALCGDLESAKTRPPHKAGVTVGAAGVTIGSAGMTIEEQRRYAIISAAKEVGPGLFFSLLIITVSFLPVFALTGQSAKLFTPLAYTKTYAMAAASILSLTLVPVLMVLLIKGKIRHENKNPLNLFFIILYRPVLNFALKWRKLTVVIAVAALASTIIPASKLGSEFMPPLNEGSLLYMPMTLPGVSITKAREILQVTNRQIMAIPEVEQAFAKAGRSDTATDPAPLAMIETWIKLKPKSEWRDGMTIKKLTAEMNERVGLPGMMNSWGYPIKIRLDMLTTGIRTAIGIKISGDDLEEIDKIAKDIEVIAQKVDGTRSAIADRVVGGKYIEIIPNRREIARYGISIKTVQDVIQTTLGGITLDEVVEGRERYPIILRYDRQFREHVSDLDNILVPSSMGAHIPLSSLAEIRINEGPSMIRSEDARLNGWVFVDIEGRDIGSYANDLREALKSAELPAGYSLKLSGQFEQMQEANERLKIAVPATLLIILTLLYLHFGAWDRTALIMLSVPFGVIGGVWGVWLAGYSFSVAVAVGFIALSGIAVETAIIMLIYIDHEMRDNWPKTLDELVENVRRGAIQRLRPKLMTVSTIFLGLAPIFFTDGAGADVMRRIALPMVGGMASTTILTLILIPVIYTIYMGKRLNLSNAQGD